MMEFTDDDPVEQPIQYYHFKCVRCKIDFYEIADLKNHYFKVHIKKTERKRSISVSAQSDEDDVNTQAKKLKRSTPSPQKKTAAQMEQEKHDETMLNRIGCLSEDEIKLFNWKGIDESGLYGNLVKYENVSKKRHLFKQGVIVWAGWKNMMWPAVLKKTTKEGGSSMKIHFRHYETGANRLGKHVFKSDSSRVELFYRCKEHADFKILGKVRFLLGSLPLACFLLGSEQVSGSMKTEIYF
jgi:hypothetical protein